jgi:hypothetical protein
MLRMADDAIARLHTQLAQQVKASAAKDTRIRSLEALRADTNNKVRNLIKCTHTGCMSL